MSEAKVLPRALRFRAGGQELAVLLAEIEQIVDPGPVLPVPYAHPALVGMLMNGDKQTPIFELLGLVNARAPFDPAVKVSAYAIFETAVGPVGLRAEAIRGTVEHYTLVDKDNPSGVPDAFLSAISGYGEADGEAFSFFSPGAFLMVLDVHKPLRPEGEPGAEA